MEWCGSDEVVTAVRGGLRSLSAQGWSAVGGPRRAHRSSDGQWRGDGNVCLVTDRIGGASQQRPTATGDSSTEGSVSSSCAPQQSGRALQGGDAVVVAVLGAQLRKC